MNEVQLNVKEKDIYNAIKMECSPYSSFDFLARTIFFNETIMLGCGHGHNTVHENMFDLLTGRKYEQQVTFGTGNGGYQKYGMKKVTVDFYDKENRIAYEIDGKNHKNKYIHLRDQVKEIILYEVHGIQTYRISNESVEKWMKERVRELAKEGVLC